MAQASINIQPVKEGSEQHNKREKYLDYVHPERTRLNVYWEKDTQANRLANIKARYFKTTGQKLQKRATPLREGVVNIEEWTTRAELDELAKRFHDRFGIDTFQIAIHKDEGYPNSENGNKLNLHAHMVFDWTDPETGKTIKLNRQQMSEMQTITAEVLGMQRGVSSDKKHLTAMQYKEKKAREEAEKAIKEKAQADQMAAAQTKAIALQSLLGGLAINAAKVEQKHVEEQTHGTQILLNHKRREIESLKQEKEKTAKEVEKLRSDASNLGMEGWKAKNKKMLLEGEISRLEGKKNEALDIIAQKEAAEKDIQSLKSMERDMSMQLDVITGEVVKQEGWRDTLKEEVQKLTQERDKAKQETAAARESLQNLTANKERVQTWKWAYNELMKLIQPILDAIKRFAHVDGRGARFEPGEVILIDFALGKDGQREERAARFTRLAEEQEEHPRLYGGYRYQCAGEHMKMIAQQPAAYYNAVQQQNQGRGMGY